MKGLFTEVEAGLRELALNDGTPMGYQQQVTVTTLRSVPWIACLCLPKTYMLKS